MTEAVGDSPLTQALMETADDRRRIGVMDEAAHEKITLPQLGDRSAPTAEPITGEEIRSMRERAHLSQAVFARYLNLTVGYVSQLERGMKHPTGPALALLNVTRRKGSKRFSDRAHPRAAFASLSLSAFSLMKPSASRWL